MGPWIAVAALVISFIVFGLAGIYTVRQQDHVNLKLCEATVTNRMAVRSTWNAARLFINQSQPENKEQTNKFFDAVLKPIPPLKCVDNRPVPR